MTEPNHAPRMISKKHFSGTLCGTPGPITMNRPTCAACLAAQEIPMVAPRKLITLAEAKDHWPQQEHLDP